MRRKRFPAWPRKGSARCCVSPSSWGGGANTSPSCGGCCRFPGGLRALRPAGRCSPATPTAAIWPPSCAARFLPRMRAGPPFLWATAANPFPCWRAGFASLGMERWHVGAIAGDPAPEALAARLRGAGVRRVVLAPLLLRDGLHASRDVFGPPPSWQSSLEAAGLAVSPASGRPGRSGRRAHSLSAPRGGGLCCPVARLNRLKKANTSRTEAPFRVAVRAGGVFCGEKRQVTPSRFSPAGTSQCRRSIPGPRRSRGPGRAR